MLSGNGSGLYDAHEWPELARSLVTLLVVLANDDDEWDYEDDSYHHHDSFCEDDLGISRINYHHHPDTHIEGIVHGVIIES